MTSTDPCSRHTRTIAEGGQLQTAGSQPIEKQRPAEPRIPRQPPVREQVATVRDARDEAPREGPCADLHVSTPAAVATQHSATSPRTSTKESMNRQKRPNCVYPLRDLRGPTTRPRPRSGAQTRRGLRPLLRPQKRPICRGSSARGAITGLF